MRNIGAANPFGVTLLHETLPPAASAPNVEHSHTIELIYVTKGKMLGYIDDLQMKLCAGDYLFIPAGVKHRFEACSNGVEAISLFSPPIDLDKPDAKIIFKKQHLKHKQKT